MIEAGSRAPDFDLDSNQGVRVSLKSLKGKTLVLYFYPRDMAPGCTKQACSFRDAQAQLKRRGAVVLGVSPDSVASHQKFKAAHKLNFPLLADPDKAVAE